MLLGKVITKLRSKRIKRDTVVSEVSKGFVHDLIIDSSRKTAQLCAGQLFHRFNKLSHEILAVSNLRSLKKHNRLNPKTMILKYLQTILTEDKCLQSPLHDGQIGTQRDDVLGIPVAIKLCQGIVEYDLVLISRTNRGVCEVAGRRKLQQNVFGISVENILYSLLPRMVTRLLIC